MRAGQGLGVRVPKRDQPPGRRWPFRTSLHSSSAQNAMGIAVKGCLLSDNTEALPTPVGDAWAVPGSSARSSRKGRCERCLVTLLERWAQLEKGVSLVSFHGLALAPLVASLPLRNNEREGWRKRMEGGRYGGEKSGYPPPERSVPCAVLGVDTAFVSSCSLALH